MKKVMLVTLALFAGMLGFGCGPLGDQMLAEQAVDSSDLAQTESALAAPAVEGFDSAMTAEQAAAAAAARAKARFSPDGCVTATVEGVKVTYLLTDCTGPYGLIHVSGTIVGTFSLVQGGVQVDLKGTELAVNRATMDLDALATLLVSGPARELTVESSSRGVGPRGNSITHAGSYVVTWDVEAACMTLEGSWQTQIGARTWWTEVTDFARCAGECPQAGGRIVHYRAIRDVTVTVDFDGTAAAQWQTSRGRSGTVNLFCGQ
jgi:hypothetical protein